MCHFLYIRPFPCFSKNDPFLILTGEDSKEALRHLLDWYYYFYESHGKNTWTPHFLVSPRRRACYQNQRQWEGLPLRGLEEGLSSRANFDADTPRPLPGRQAYRVLDRFRQGIWSWEILSIPNYNVARPRNTGDEAEWKSGSMKVFRFTFFRMDRGSSPRYTGKRKCWKVSGEKTLAPEKNLSEILLWPFRLPQTGLTGHIPRGSSLRGTYKLPRRAIQWRIRP